MCGRHIGLNRPSLVTAVSKGLVLGGVLVAVLVVALAAQDKPPAAQARRQGWRPWYYSYDATGLTPAERRAITDRASAYERLFVVRDSLIRPQGFEATSHVFGGLGPAGRLGQWGYNIIFFDGIGHEGPSLLWAYENVLARNVWTVDSGAADFKDGQGEIYRERPKGSPLPGLPAGATVFGALTFDSTESRDNVVQVLLTADGELPWSDVSRERLLNMFITEAAAAVETDRQALSQTTYQRWLSDAPRRRQEREQMLVAITAIDKAQAATVKAEMEKGEQATGESLKQNDATERAQWSQALAADTARLTQRRAELAAMSPAERAVAAWVDAGSGGTSKLVAPGAPGASHLIADKPDYYRVRGSRLEARSLLIGFRLTNAKPGDRLQGDLFDRAVSDAYRAFDWAAASRLLGSAAK
jgi:hypothetical protein